MVFVSKTRNTISYNLPQFVHSIMIVSCCRWCGVRDSAHEKLYDLLKDPVPEVSSYTSSSLNLSNYCGELVTVIR